MAQINARRDDKILAIDKWRGLHQSPDGDVGIKIGEASSMINWRITRDGALQRRPGTALKETLGTGPVRLLWSGIVQGNETILAACDGRLWRLHDGTGWVKEDIGAVNTDGEVFAFGFSECAYILDGVRYLVYDGETLKDVEGYRPLVLTATTPEGSGTILEQVNKLTGGRRAIFSPDGKATVFQLPEKGIKSIDYVKDLVTGEPITGYTPSLSDGTVTFAEAPGLGTASLEIGWTFPVNYRSQVEQMRFAEIYNGTQDSRVFLYGDGSNQLFYSGLDTSGVPRADYFPDLNVVAIGEANTPVTACIRSSSTLVVYKPNSTWSVIYSQMSLADSRAVAAFYARPVNRAIGNVAPGQAQLVLNYPRTLHGSDVYEWKSSSAFQSSDERTAQRISDRIATTLSVFNLEDCTCYDDNYAQEYYISAGNNALVHNYASDAWYYYSNFPSHKMLRFRDGFFTGSEDGKIYEVARRFLDDDGKPIEAYWESGNMDFGADWMRKYTSMLWVTVKPESNSYVEITVKTDKKTENAEKVIAKGSGFFSNMDFANFSFNTTFRPQSVRLKIKSKKYVYYKLVFKTDKANTTATVLRADIRSRTTGYAK